MWILSATCRIDRTSFRQQCLKRTELHHAIARCFSAFPPRMYYGQVRDQILPTHQITKDLFHHIKEPHTVSVIGAPLTYGQPYVGTDKGPALLRQYGLLSQLATLGWRVEDAADISFSAPPPTTPSSSPPLPPSSHTNAKNSHLVGRACQIIANTVEEKTLAGHLPLTIGGDHSLALGTLAGVLRARPRTGVLWIDAHADLNTPANSLSGNMHGMPLGLIVEGVYRCHDEVPGLEWLAEGCAGAPRLPSDSLVYVGLRDVDEAERDTIRDMGILAFTMFDIDRYGIGAVMDRALGHLLDKDPDRPIHLSWDIDAVDPVLAPATGTTVRGGLTYREAHYVAEAAALSGALSSVDLVEFNPQLSDGEGQMETCELALGVVTSLMGKSII